VEVGLLRGRERHGRCLGDAADMEKAGCCGSLAYGPMAKMEAADAGSSRDRMLWVTRARRGWDLAGAAKGRTVIGTVDWAGWGAGV
jgi:hypothetical protein